jgi:REase_DpnII-MboI
MMANRVQRRREIEQLVAKNEEFETRMSLWQKEPTADDEEIKGLQTEYSEWFVKAQRYIPETQIAKFRDMYEGGEFIQRIRAFLLDPLAPNQFYSEDKENPFIGRWRNPFEGRVRDSLVTQREILIKELYEADEATLALEELASIFRRFPDFVRSLRLNANSNIVAPRITREKDFQILILAILRLLYKDVRQEDPASKHAGASSRVDFSIRDVDVVVETKMVREGQSDRNIGNELLIDWGRYPKHPNCQGILAIIYDPNERLDNPIELETDLTQSGRSPSTRAVVVR